MHTNKRLVALLSVLLILGTLLAPVIALADDGNARKGAIAAKVADDWGEDVTQLAGRRGWHFARAQMTVPPNPTKTYRLDAGPVRLLVPPDALPEGGPVRLRVVWNDRGRFVADFTPDRQFDANVLMDFGVPKTVYYHSASGKVRIDTQDLDGDGEVGEIYSDHFSRFSGW